MFLSCQEVGCYIWFWRLSRLAALKSVVFWIVTLEGMFKLGHWTVVCRSLIRFLAFLSQMRSSLTHKNVALQWIFNVTNTAVYFNYSLEALGMKFKWCTRAEASFFRNFPCRKSFVIATIWVAALYHPIVMLCQTFNLTTLQGGRFSLQFMKQSCFYSLRSANWWIGKLFV